MNDVLDSTVQRLRGLVDFDCLVILLFDETDGYWTVLRQEGCSLQTTSEHGVARLSPAGRKRAEGDETGDCDRRYSD